MGWRMVGGRRPGHGDRAGCGGGRGYRADRADRPAWARRSHRNRDRGWLERSSRGCNRHPVRGRRHHVRGLGDHRRQRRLRLRRVNGGTFDLEFTATGYGTEWFDNAASAAAGSLTVGSGQATTAQCGPGSATGQHLGYDHRRLGAGVRRDGRAYVGGAVIGSATSAPRRHLHDQ